MESWKKTYTEEIGHHWARYDGAVVKKHETPYTKTWLATSRQWLAYAPGENYPLSYRRKNSGFKFSRNFQTAENAMKILDREFPVGISPTAS